MNAAALFEILNNVQDGDVITLEENSEIDVWSDECSVVSGYHFSNTATYDENPNGVRPVGIYLKGKKNIVIDGNGAEIRIHGIITPFLFDRCENITLKNIKFDYARPTMSEFDIVENCSEGVYLLRVLPESLFEIEGNNLIWCGEKGKNGRTLWKNHYRDPLNITMYQSPETKYVKMTGKETRLEFPCIPKFANIERISESKLLVTLENKDAFFPVGCRIQTRKTVRDQIGGCFMLCKNVRFENSSIYAMHGLGILAQYCDGVFYDRLTIVPRNGRTIASNADFFQISGCCGAVIIQNCVLEGGHDDFINIHGTYLKIVEKSGKKIKVHFCNPSSRGFEAFFANDAIDFIDSRTLVPYESAIVENAIKVNDTDIELQLDKDCFARIGDCVENATRTPSVVIKNNSFGPSMGRGILCTTRKDVIIKDNIFYKLGGSVLCIESDCNFWYESGFIGKLTFQKNTVIDCGYGFDETNQPVIWCRPQILDFDKKVYPHKKLIIKENFFCHLPENSYHIGIYHVEKVIYDKNISDQKIRIEGEYIKNLSITDIKRHNYRDCVAYNSTVN